MNYRIQILSEQTIKNGRGAGSRTGSRDHNYAISIYSMEQPFLNVGYHFPVEKAWAGSWETTIVKGLIFNEDFAKMFSGIEDSDRIYHLDNYLTAADINGKVAKAKKLAEDNAFKMHQSLVSNLPKETGTPEKKKYEKLMSRRLHQANVCLDYQGKEEVATVTAKASWLISKEQPDNYEAKLHMEHTIAVAKHWKQMAHAANVICQSLQAEESEALALADVAMAKNARKKAIAKAKRVITPAMMQARHGR